jgi:hypothetical protein
VVQWLQIGVFGGSRVIFRGDLTMHHIILAVLTSRKHTGLDRVSQSGGRGCDWRGCD